MWQAIISNWQGFAIGAALVASTSFGGGFWVADTLKQGEIDHIKAVQSQVILDAQKAAEEIAKKQVKQTEKVSHDLQTKNTDLLKHYNIVLGKLRQQAGTSSNLPPNAASDPRYVEATSCDGFLERVGDGATARLMCFAQYQTNQLVAWQEWYRANIH